MEHSLHPATTDHLPFFLTPPGGHDVLMTIMIVVMVVLVLVIGNLYFQLHALPERMAHRTSKIQMEFVAVLTLIALFTHEHIFWIAALLLAFIEFPDFTTPIESVARSLAKLSGRDDPLLGPDPVDDPHAGDHALLEDATSTERSAQAEVAIVPAATPPATAKH